MSKPSLIYLSPCHEKKQDKPIIIIMINDNKNDNNNNNNELHMIITILNINNIKKEHTLK